MAVKSKARALPVWRDVAVRAMNLLLFRLTCFMINNDNHRRPFLYSSILQTTVTPTRPKPSKYEDQRIGLANSRRHIYYLWLTISAL